jgi:transcriptional regulator with XRE-family HTH domain
MVYITMYNRLYCEVMVPRLRSSPSVAGSLILAARLKSGLTQRDLADRLNVSQPTVAAYESGRRQPTVPTLMRWLAAAGFDLRMTLVPRDDHDDVLESLERLRSPEDQERWQRYQRERVQAARDRLERTK